MLLPEQEKERNKIRNMIEGDIRKLSIQVSDYPPPHTTGTLSIVT